MHGVKAGGGHSSSESLANRLCCFVWSAKIVRLSFYTHSAACI